MPVTGLGAGIELPDPWNFSGERDGQLNIKFGMDVNHVRWGYVYNYVSRG